MGSRTGALGKAAAGAFPPFGIDLEAGDVSPYGLGHQSGAEADQPKTYHRDIETGGEAAAAEGVEPQGG